MSLTSLTQSLTYHAGTTFYFTKSDIKTTIIPVTVFAIVAAPIYSLDRLPHIVFWIWLHLLQFDVSNQTVDPEEDKHNKADRPLASGRITLRNALILRWLLVPACFFVSALYSMQVLYASVTLAVLFIIYNEMQLHAGHWSLRNLLNASGFMMFETGATLVAGADRSRLDYIAVLAICLSTCMFASTYHVQDFKDVEGDKLIGRQTLPIVHPKQARKTVIVGLLTWSIALVLIWELDIVSAAALVLLGTLIGLRFLKYKTIADDQVSFYLYNVWLSYVHALPAYWRLKLML